jgi:hypothetical protein
MVVTHMVSIECLWIYSARRESRLSIVIEEASVVVGSKTVQAVSINNLEGDSNIRLAKCNSCHGKEFRN